MVELQILIAMALAIAPLFIAKMAAHRLRFVASAVLAIERTWFRPI
jgi:hypothetical protein